MGHNPSRHTLKRLSADTQHAVDAYKSRSVWSTWWSLDEKLRRRYFTRDERAFITRYGARLDELACFRSNPRNEKEQHFLRVCSGEEEPSSPRERLWLLVQIVCRYQRAVDRAARADLAEQDAFSLRAENRALKAKNDHLERYAHGLASRLARMDEARPAPVCNVVWMTPRFREPEICGPAPAWRVVSASRRGPPVAMLTTRGLTAIRRTTIPST